MTNLYILTSDGYLAPATLDMFNAWEDEIPEQDRTALGKRLRIDHAGDVTIVSFFIAAPVGWHNRKPQVFLTMSIGKGVWNERRYTSLRACINGHREEVKLHRDRSTLALATTV